VREQLWYYSGLVKFLDQRRPGPLAEDLWRAVGELAWLSLYDAAETHQLVHWLIDQAEPTGRDFWPTEEISFHGPAAPAAWRQLQGAIAYHAELRGSSDPILDAQRAG